MRTPDGRDVHPPEHSLLVGTPLYRVHSNDLTATQYNPGFGEPSRFAFFPGDADDPGSELVPVLYAADAEMGAVSETILHDVPLAGGQIDRDTVQSKILSRVVVSRDLQLVGLFGDGFRRIGTPAEEITRTSPRRYRQTVTWATAAYDGMVWMSRHHDTSRAYVLFGRDGRSDVAAHPDPSTARAFAVNSELDWLTAQLNPLNVVIADPV